ncbi:hypothetical protein [Arsenicibacter rosenii]|uniref:hypothetical protein n=1 Tax=Arsenicibacter rosenii TaxID=1750698 RepID=UPI0015A65322|nr:hypothetical protein [Arsenicibacter rosenii]
MQVLLQTEPFWQIDLVIDLYRLLSGCTLRLCAYGVWPGSGATYTHQALAITALFRSV